MNRVRTLWRSTWGMIPRRRRLVAQGIAIIAASWLVVGLAMLAWSPAWPADLPAASRRPAQAAWEGWARLAIIAYVADFLYLKAWLMLRRSRFRDRFGLSLITSNLTFALVYHLGACYALWPALMAEQALRLGSLGFLALVITWGFVELLLSQDEEATAADPWAPAIAGDELVIISGDDDRIAWADPEGAALFGFRPADLIGQDVTTLVPERFRAAHLAARRRFHRTGEGALLGKTARVPALTKDGREIAVCLELVPLRVGRARWVVAILTPAANCRSWDIDLTESPASEAG